MTHEELKSRINIALSWLDPPFDSTGIKALRSDLEGLIRDLESEEPKSVDELDNVIARGKKTSDFKVFDLADAGEFGPLYIDYIPDVVEPDEVEDEDEDDYSKSSHWYKLANPKPLFSDMREICALFPDNDFSVRKTFPDETPSHTSPFAGFRAHEVSIFVPDVTYISQVPLPDWDI